MKVLFLFEGLPHYYNDILNRLNTLDNIEVTVLVPQKKGESLGKGVHESDEGVRFTVLRGEEYITYYGKPFFKNLDSIISEQSPDVIISGWPYIQGFFIHLSIRKLLKQKNILLVEKSIPYLLPKYNEARKFYGDGKNISEEDESIVKKPNAIAMMRYFLLTEFRKWYFPKIDAHVCYVEDAVDILGSYGVKKEKVFIIYNSPDTDKIFATKRSIERSEKILAPNSFRIIHVGRLVRWKKVHMLINVVAKLQKRFPEIELLVVGTGPEEQSLRQQVEQRGAEKNVKFLGGVYDQTLLGKYFLESSIYVLAGVGGLSINEAMCYGKPIICSECDGTEKKLVREDFNGKYFRNNDEDDLLEKISYLFDRPEVIASMGQNSLRIIQDEVNVNTVVTGYAKAFNYLEQLKNKI